jgi:hypothetical protein
MSCFAMVPCSVCGLLCTEDLMSKMLVNKEGGVSVNYVCRDCQGETVVVELGEVE